MRAVVIFTVVYTVGFWTYGQVVESPLANLYTGITLGLFVLFAILNRWAKWPLHALWAMSLVGLGNVLGGVLLVDGVPLYTADLVGNLRFDKVFHAAAATAFAIVAWEAMKAWSGEGYREGPMLMMTWLVVMGGGAVVEIAELIGSALSDVSVGNYWNNAYDLVANGTGAAVGIALVWWWERRAAT